MVGIYPKFGKKILIVSFITLILCLLTTIFVTQTKTGKDLLNMIKNLITGIFKKMKQQTKQSKKENAIVYKNLMLINVLVVDMNYLEMNYIDLKKQSVLVVKKT